MPTSGTKTSEPIMVEKNPKGPEWWNRVSGLAGKILHKTGESEAVPDDEPVLTVEEQRQQALDVFRTLLASHKGSAALALFHKTVQACESWELPEKELLQFAELLLAEKLWNAAVTFLEDYLKRYTKRVIPVRLRLAQTLIEQQQRPSYAARVLNELPREGLGEKEEKLRTALEQKAQKMIDEGVLELEGRPW
jgi:hypothetical protein